MSKSVFESYTFCPACGHELESKGAYKTCPACGKHQFFNARPTVTAIIVNDAGEYLLSKRKYEPFKDWWDLAGGFVEEHESLEAAVQREILEELGVHIEVPKYLGSVPEEYVYQDTTLVVVASMFLCKLPAGQTIQVGDDVSDYSFFAAADLPIDKIAFQNQREFFRAYLTQ